MSTPREDEQDTRALAERLRRSFDDDLSGHAIATPDGGILHCNAEFARIIGAPTVDDALTMNLHELEPVPGAFDQLLRRLQRTPLIPLERVRFVRRDGTRAQVMARLAASRDPGGQVSEVRVYLVDVSEQHRETRRLRARAERLRLAELATHDVTWDWDVPTARVRWNRAAVRRFRYTPDEVRPTIDWHVDRIHPEDRERVLRGMERTIFGIDNAWADEYRVLRGDGTYATVLDRAYVVRNGRCEPVRVVGSIVDITELKATEAAYRFLSAAGAELETALDVTSTAATLARISVPELAGFCLVDLRRRTAHCAASRSLMRGRARSRCSRPARRSRRARPWRQWRAGTFRALPATARAIMRAARSEWMRRSSSAGTSRCRSAGVTERWAR